MPLKSTFAAKRMISAIAALTCALVSTQSAIDAQVLYGSIVGNVNDPSIAPVPGALVTITNRETGQARQTTTNDVGSYTFSTVGTGTYDVKVTKEGFQTTTLPNVVVTINSVARADLNLKVGAVSETVSVTSEAPSLQTDRSEVRTEITTKTLTDLPVPPGRNYQQLFRSIPGFTPPGNAHSVPSNPSRSLMYNVNGASASSNDVRVDGASQFNVWLPHVTAYTPALEAIETVNVVTNTFDAEQGLAGGSAVSVQIKSGTNDLHGSLFEYHNNNNTKARPFFLPATQGKPKWVYNQFGGTIGGPIVKNKLFFFGSYEGTYDRQFAFRQPLLTVPTAAMRSGDLSASPTPIYDPLTGDRVTGAGRTAFAGNIIPESRIDPIARKVLALFPLPNQPGNLLTANYFASGGYAFDRHTGDGKINWNASDKLTMYARASVLRYDMFNDPSFGASGGPEISSAGGNPGIGFGNTGSATIAATYIFSPSFIVDANFGYTIMDSNVEQPGLDENLGLAMGIPGVNGTRRFEGGLPRFTISNGFTNVGINNDFMPYFRHDPQYHYVANANWTKGSHNVRFGFDYARQNMNHTQPEFPGASHGAQGGFTFGPGPTQIAGGPAGNQFNSIATLLLGYHTTAGRILQVPDEYSTNTSLHSLYIRDQWAVTRKLTLSYGTRWEYFPMPGRADRGLEVYDFVANKMKVCGVGTVPRDCDVGISKKGFAPRIGFAYRPTDTLVIRAGYGITNDPFNLAKPHRTNHPQLLAYTLPAPNAFAPAGRLADGIPVIPAPDLGNGIIDIPNNVGVNSTPADFKRGYIQSWNLVIQKQLWAGFTGEAGYVATRQVNLVGYLDLNAGQIIGAGQQGRPYFPKFGRTARTAAIQPIGNTHYDSLQTKLNRRYSNGVQMQFAYTWSKAMGICGVGAQNDQDPCVRAIDYYRLNWSPQSFDRTHNFQANFMAELPFGRGKKFAQSGFAKAILGGWQVNGLFSAYSGTPFTPTSSGTSLNLPESTQRADQVKGEVKKLGGVGRGQAYYDWTAYAPVRDARFGTAGFNSLRGPELVNLDMGLFRQFNFTERVNMQFRVEAFNATNTPHFSNPNTNISDLLLNSDGSFRSGVFEVTGVTGTGREGIDERVFRFGIRIGF
jgi:hypothetical protein